MEVIEFLSFGFGTFNRVLKYSILKLKVYQEYGFEVIRVWYAVGFLDNRV